MLDGTGSFGDLRRFRPTPVLQRNGDLPCKAIASKIEGTAELRVKINAKGFIEDIQIDKSSGHQILDDAAIGSVYQWVFKAPADKERMQMIVPVQFRLTEASFRELPTKPIRPAPFYPYQAMAKRLRGSTKIGMTVSERGFVSKAEIRESSGHKLLDYSALITTYRWAFAPRVVDGRPVCFDADCPVVFKP